MAIYEDDIDLRPYVLALIQRKWLILLVVTIAAGLALIISLGQPRVYKATATILISRSQPQLSLSEQFPSVSESIDPARLAAVMAVLETDGFAAESFQGLIDSKVIRGSMSLPSFKDMVEMRNDGGTLRVTVASEDPEQASEIANAWARFAVEKINLIYMEEQPLEETRTQMASAQDDFSLKQQALEDFIRQDQRPLLQQQIDQAQFTLDKVKEDKQWWVDYYTKRRQSLRDLAIQAQGLKDQLQAGSSSTAARIGDALAVLDARMAALDFTTTLYPNPAQSPSLQINDLEALQNGTEDAVLDLDKVIKMTEAEIAKADKELEAIINQTVNVEDDQVATNLNRRLQSLQAQLETTNSQEKEMMSQRDLSWQVYQLLAEKESEILTGTGSSRFANLAARAVPPQLPAPRGALRNTALAGLGGMILVMTWVVVGEWWKSSKVTNVNVPVAESAD